MAAAGNKRDIETYKYHNVAAAVAGVIKDKAVSCLSLCLLILLPGRDRITITPSVYAPYFSTQYILWTQETLENIDDNLKGYVLFYTSFLDR